MSTTKKLNRRDFLRLSATAAAGVVLEACVSPTSQTVEVDDIPKSTTKVAFEFWAQDWGPAIEIFENAAQRYMELYDNATINVKPIPYEDIETKLLPAVAAGTEGDGFMSYSNLWQVVDFTKLLLPLTPEIMSKEEAEELIYPGALNAMKGPDNQVYGMPFASGIDGSYFCTYDDHFEGDYNFKQLEEGTWAALIDVAKEMTLRDSDGRIVRAGMNLGYWFEPVANWIISLGGTIYDEDAKRWTLQTPEAEWAFQELFNLYNTYEVCDYELVTGAADPFVAGLVSMTLEGSYLISALNESVPDLKVSGFIMPRLASVAEEDVKYWNGTIGILSLSRKLWDDPAKLEVGREYLKLILEPENLLDLLDVFSGGIPSPGVYRSTDLLSKKYGPLTKDFGEKIWERTVFTGNAASPYQSDEFYSEIERLIRGEIPVSELLESLDRLANEMETEAQERKSSG